MRKMWSLCLLPSQGLMLLLVSYLGASARDLLQLVSLGPIYLLPQGLCPYHPYNHYQEEEIPQEAALILMP